MGAATLIGGGSNQEQQAYLRRGLLGISGLGGKAQGTGVGAGFNE